MGALSFHESGGEDAHPARSACRLYLRSLQERWQVELFFDDLPYCTPLYVIEKTESVDWDCTFAGFLRDMERCQELGNVGLQKNPRSVRTDLGCRQTL